MLYLSVALYPKLRIPPAVALVHAFVPTMIVCQHLQLFIVQYNLLAS